MPPGHPTDREIKSLVVERLKENPHTQDDDIRVDVKQAVVVLGGEVSSWPAKRAAGDDAWDTPGVEAQLFPAWRDSGGVLEGGVTDR